MALHFPFMLMWEFDSLVASPRSHSVTAFVSFPEFTLIRVLRVTLVFPEKVSPHILAIYSDLMLISSEKPMPMGDSSRVFGMMEYATGCSF